MIRIRRSRDRGRMEYGWLSARYSFSFGRYHDPRWMGFRSLRVLNEDWIQPARGFPKHPHRDMEILTWVLEGALRHRDSEGNGGVIRPGLVQRMSAGRGIFHSEFNASKKDLVHLLQIWLLPEKNGLKPSYEQRRFPENERRGVLRKIASRDGGDESVRIHQDATVYASVLRPEETLTHRLGAGRHAWVQIASGRVGLGRAVLAEGDGAAIASERELVLEAQEGAELLLFDLA